MWGEMDTVRRGKRSQRYVQWIAVLVSAALVALVATNSYAAASSRPSAPAKVVAVPGNQFAIVHWTAGSDHGARITGYRITAYLGGAVQMRKTVGRVTQTKIAGLQNAKRYSFRVTAHNVHGFGPAHASHPVTIGTPIAPTHVTARPVRNGMRVQWRAPANKNGSPLAGYVVVPHLHGAAQTPRKFATSAVSQVITGLEIGKIYTFTVAAKNGVGTGPASNPSTQRKLACIGVHMTAGQQNINAAPSGTTFCLSGTHNWTLSPKSGDELIGPATLDGQHSTQYAIDARATTTNVVISGLEIRNYQAGSQQGAIFAPNPLTTNWVLQDLRVHDNGTSAGGAGANLGTAWHVRGGRYYNNRQEGFGGIGANSTINGVEIDHNNFTDDTYKKRNIACSFEAGGAKWVNNNITVSNSRIHDNACRGLWVDINAQHAKIINNKIYDNWDEGILIEISSYATVTRNTVYDNGRHCYEGTGNGCIWLLGAGISLLASDHVEVAHNKVYGNVNGIVGIQENRPDGHPGLLQDNYIHDNNVAGPGGKTGLAANNGVNLATRGIVFANNVFKNGMSFCHNAC